MTRKISELLVVSDMDGTLLTSGHQLLPANLATIRLFTSMGGRFSVASGRVAASVLQYTELHPFLSPIITSGGAVIYDVGKKEMLKNALLPRAVGRRVVADVLGQFPGAGAVVMGADGRNYLLNPTNALYRLFDDENLQHFLRPLEDFPADWSKVLFADKKETLESIEAFVAERTYPGVYFVATSDLYFEMLPQGATKGGALAELCEMLHQPLENTIVIGDYYNDLDMMAQAGHAVAMSNAPIEVRLQADEVTTSSNEEGGVGQYLYQLMRGLEP